MEPVDKRRKKKRVATGDMELEGEGEGNALKKLKTVEEDAVAGGSGFSDPTAVPTEEEVEEFFAILRRMKVAVDYFDLKGKGGKEWKEVLEQADFTVDDDAEDVDGGGDRREPDGTNVKKNDGQEVAVNEGFDLNAVAPEAADA